MKTNFNQYGTNKNIIFTEETTDHVVYFNSLEMILARVN